MLYFLHFLSDGGDVFNLFRYITFRAGGAFFTSLAFGFLFSKPIINFLRKRSRYTYNGWISYNWVFIVFIFIMVQI